MQHLLVYSLVFICLGKVACSSTEDLEKRLGKSDQAANSQSSISPTQTGTMTSATSTATATNSSTNTVVQSDTDPTIATSTKPATSTKFSLCPDGDSVKLQIPDSIKTCMDQSRLWNFGANQCTAMRQTSFDCNFDLFFKKLEELGIQASTGLKEAKNSNAIIIGCGESATRDTVLIQWVPPPPSPLTSCVAVSKIYTGCYGKDSRIPDGTSDVSKIVTNCMNGTQAP